MSNSSYECVGALGGVATSLTLTASAWRLGLLPGLRGLGSGVAEGEEG